MAGERTLPGLGIRAFWTAGSDGYNAELDPDLRLLSALVQCRVLSRVADYPESPGNGDMHILTGTADANDIVAYDVDTWINYTPEEGFLAYDRATNELLLFDGSVWTVFESGGGSVAIQKDGTGVVDPATVINFTGTGVTVTDVSGVATVAIDGDMTGTEIVAAIDAELGNTDWKTGGGAGSSVGIGIAGWTAPGDVFTAENASTPDTNAYEASSDTWLIETTGAQNSCFAKHTVSGDFDKVFTLRVSLADDTNAAVGLFVGDSSNGEKTHVSFHTADANRTLSQNFSGTSFQGSGVATRNPIGLAAITDLPHFYMRVQRVSATVNYYYSSSGLDWFLMATHNATPSGIATLDEVGVYFESNGVSGGVTGFCRIIGLDDGPQAEITTGGSSDGDGGSGGSGGATTFVALTDTPSAFTGEGGKVVKVNAGGTALEFATESSGGASTIEEIDGIDATRSALGVADNGRALIWDNSADAFIPSAAGFDGLRLGGGIELIYENADLDTFTSLVLDEANYDIDIYDELVVVFEGASTRLYVELSDDGGVTVSNIVRWIIGTGALAGAHTQFRVGTDANEAGSGGVIRIQNHSMPGAYTWVQAHGYSTTDTDAGQLISGHGEDQVRHNAISLSAGGGSTFTAGKLQVFGIKKSRQPLEYSARFSNWADTDEGLRSPTMGCKFRAGTIGKIVLDQTPGSTIRFEVQSSDGTTIGEGLVTAAATEGDITVSTSATVSDEVVIVATTGRGTATSARIAVRGELA